MFECCTHARFALLTMPFPHYLANVLNIATLMQLGAVSWHAANFSGRVSWCAAKIVAAYGVSVYKLRNERKRWNALKRVLTNQVILCVVRMHLQEVYWRGRTGQRGCLQNPQKQPAELLGSAEQFWNPCSSCFFAN